MSYKRILNELNNKIPEMLKNYDLDNLFCAIQCDNNIVPKKISIVNKKTEQVEIIFDLPNSYPFKPPNLTIYNSQNTFYGVSYNNWNAKIIDHYANSRIFIPNNDLAWYFTIIRRPQLFKFWYGVPNKKDCLCCNNFTCPSQWSPSITMGHLICEYVTRNDFKIYCGKLQQKCMFGIFNNEKWTIPDDIILYIIYKMF